MQPMIGQRVQEDNLKSLFQPGNGYQQTLTALIHYQTTTSTFSLICRVGLDNKKIEPNPAARIRRKPEGGGRVRFLSETEEKRFRGVPAPFLLSIHTGDAHE